MEDTAVRIFWAADSTVQTNDITTYPQTGIGQVFSLYTREGVVLSNHAKNGRSTKSFMDEGRLAVIEGQMYINAARKHHAHPVLITPLERRCFVDARHLGMGAHSDYVAAMKQTAEKNRVPLVDLYSMSRSALKSAGEPDSRSWYMYFDAGVYENYPEGKTDNTHLRYEGAVRFAGMIAQGLRELGGIYADLLLDVG